MKKIIPTSIGGILVWGIVLHLVVMPFTYHGDMTNYDGWGSYILDKGSQTVYDHDFGTQLLSDANYPPFMLWTCAVVSGAIRLLRSAVWQMNILVPVFPSQLVTFFAGEMPYIYLFKVLVILANAGIAVFIYKLVQHGSVQSDNVSMKSAALFLFNPAIIYGSTVWGQIDLIPIFFVLASLYILFYKKQVLWSSLLIIVALLFKQTTIIFFPLYAVAIFRYFGMKYLVKSLVLMTTTIWLVYAPFVSTWSHIFSPFIRYLTKVQLASDNEYTTKFAWNLWMIVHGVTPVSDVQQYFGGITFQLIGYIGVFMTVLYIVFQLRRKPRKNLREGAYFTLFAFFLIAFSSFLLLTRLHERHLLHTLPFFIILIGSHKRFMHSFVYLTLFILANLLIAWDQFRLNLHGNDLVMALIRISIMGALGMFIFYLRQFSLAPTTRRK